MSWDGYIDSVITSSNGACDKVCLIGLNGGGTWTTCAHEKHINIQHEESVAIADAMKKDPLDDLSFQTKGIIIDGTKYQFIRSDKEDGYVLGKKKDIGAITIHKTNTGIIVAHTAEGKNQGSTNKGVKEIADYLKSINM